MFRNLLLALVMAGLLIGPPAQAQKNEGLYFVFLHSNPDKPQISDDEIARLQEAHLANIDRLAKAGKLLAAGPFEGGGGILILDAADQGEATQLLESDPAVQAQRFRTELLPFRVTGNDLCGATEPYEMVTYQFIRLISNPAYFDDFDDMMVGNRTFLANLNNQHDYVVAYGSFSDYNDGIVILDVSTAEEAEDIIKEHPSVKADQLTYEIRSLWIARGTFCKK